MHNQKETAQPSKVLPSLMTVCATSLVLACGDGMVSENSSAGDFQVSMLSSNEITSSDGVITINHNSDNVQIDLNIEQEYVERKVTINPNLVLVNGEVPDYYYYSYSILQPQNDALGSVAYSFINENFSPKMAYGVRETENVVPNDRVNYEGVWYAYGVANGGLVEDMGQHTDGRVEVNPSNGTWTAYLGPITLSGNLIDGKLQGDARYVDKAAGKTYKGNLKGYNGTLNGTDVTFGSFGGDSGSFGFVGVWDY